MYIKPDFLGQDDRPRPERKHVELNEMVPWDSNKSNDDPKLGKFTFLTHNRKSVNEYAVEGKMGNKKRV